MGFATFCREKSKEMQGFAGKNEEFVKLAESRILYNADD